MAELVIPTIPAQPAEGATWQEWDVWLRRVALSNDAELRSRQAAAQQATADAMLASVSAQEALAAAMNQPMPQSVPRKADMVLQVASELPQITAMTDLQMIDMAIKRVDAWLTRFPGAAQ